LAGARQILFIIVEIKRKPFAYPVKNVSEIEFVDTNDIVTPLLFSSVIGLGSR